jgi:hypothetical protein
VTATAHDEIDLLRVGVTGHRDLAHLDDVIEQVDRTLDDLLTGRPDGTTLEVWSSLAEGADRVVAERALGRPNAHLVVVLPFEADEYRRDFLTPDSLEEFDALLGRARAVEISGPDASGTRESAYERAGQRVVEASGVLVELWDGEPSRGQGGTAEIIEHARATGRHVVILPVRRRSIEEASS